jgi:hypothetical protein
MFLSSLLLAGILTGQPTGGADTPVQVRIDTAAVALDHQLRIYFYAAEGIDSMAFPIDPFEFSYRIQFHDRDGLLRNQDTEGRRLISWEYELTPYKTGVHVLPNARLWVMGKAYDLNLSGDTIHVLTSITQARPLPPDMGHSPKPLYPFRHLSSVNLECPLDRTCSKAWFSDTAFQIGDTVMLVAGINVARAMIYVPSPKNMRYISHYTTSKLIYEDGNKREQRLMAAQYVLTRDVRKLNTGLIKARYDGFTYYIRKVKVKNANLK